MRNFREWRIDREKHHPDEVCHDDIFDSGPWDAKELYRWLSLYVHETRRSDGERYQLSTMLSLLSEILWHMRSVQSRCTVSRKHLFR